MRVFLAAMLALFLSTAAAAQIDPRSALLEKAGFDALDAQQIDRAIALFREAVTSDPKNADLHLGLGIAAYLQQRDDDAQRELERAAALDPRLDAAHEFLGLALHHAGDVAAAVREYDTWLSHAPASDRTRRASQTLDRWRREIALGNEMQDALGEHFTVSFDGPAEAPLAERAIASLERAYWRIGPLLGVYPPRAVPVILYTADQFHDITRSPSWAAASYDGTIRVPMRGALDQPEELDRVLAHEFTHALVHALAPRAVPTWLNEGLAASLESDSIDWAEKIAAQAPAIPLTALAGSFAPLNGTDAAVAYAESAMAVHRLLDEIGGTGVANLLRDLGEGAPFDVAFAHRAQQSFTDFSARLRP